ncbi:MAG: ABC transporter permease [Deltaproteobacteria bacterium]|nr:MAG: ABC transporter permease [Deltaproteobacteria bacterium]
MRGTGSLLRLGLAMGALLVLVAAVGPTLAPYDPAAPVAPQLAEPMPPAAPFYLGTDDLGRDVLSRLLHGARISLLVGVVAMVVTMVIGTAIGLAAGYFGGGVDVVLMRVTDVMLAFPGLLLAVALVAVLRPSVWTIFVVIGLVSWTGVARVIRSEVLSLRERDFVLAARALGARHARILRRHVLVNVVPTIVVIAALSTSGTILLDAGLSFLGIGVPPPTPTWGRMIQEATAYYRVAPWLMLFPGAAVLYAVLTFNFIAYGLAGDGRAPGA